MTRGQPLPILTLVLSLLLSACAGGREVAHAPAPETGADAGDIKIIEVYDPFEGFNRRAYRFNAELDRMILLPAVELYEFLLPDFARDGVANAFANLDNLITFANQLLQGKPLGASQTAFRFSVNFIAGVGGLADVASAIGAPAHEEDFGQTLAVWGLGSGPYLVLPVLGPSNVRDAVGSAADRVAFAVIDPFDLSSVQGDQPALLALGAVNARAIESFRYYGTGSPFEYEFVRLLYNKQRELEIAR